MTPLEKAARALVAKWRAIYEEDVPDYYAGQYSRADECADDLEAALDAAPTQRRGARCPRPQPTERSGK
jgi:hypothetical protein